MPFYKTKKKDRLVGRLLAGLLLFWGTELYGQVLESIDSRVETLLNSMTLGEKVGQMTQLTLQAVSSQAETATSRYQLDSYRLQRALSGFAVGSILNVWDAAFTLEHWREVITKIQLAARKTRLGIPVLYAIDAVHGHHYLRNGTVFPHNLGFAATRDPELVRRTSELTALETRATGIPWNFAPVLDVARQPLWSCFFRNLR